MNSIAEALVDAVAFLEMSGRDVVRAHDPAGGGGGRIPRLHAGPCRVNGNSGNASILAVTFRILALVVLVSLAACTSIRIRQNSFFPAFDAVAYEAPDGARWVIHESGSKPDGSFWLWFTPEHAEPGKWSELLAFGLTREDFRPAAVRSALEQIKASAAPDCVYRIDGDDAACVWTYHSERLQESGVQKAVRLPTGRYCFVGYRERLAREGTKRLRFWTKLIKRLPIQGFAPQPIGPGQRFEKVRR